MNLLKKNMMLKSKKGLDYYTLIVALVGILILSFVLFSLFTKQLKLTSGIPIGTDQFRLLKTYSTAEKVLAYVDNSARLALEQAAFDSAKKGLYVSPATCGSNGNINYWTKDTISPSTQCIPQPVACYPDQAITTSTVSTLFSPVLSKFVAAFNAKNDIKIPFNYPPFAVSQITAGTEVVGKSNEPVKIEIPSIKYEIKPNFRESIPVDVVGEGQELVADAQQLNRQSKSTLDSKIAALNSAGKYKWALDYSRVGSSCTYDTGETCSYVCGEECSDSCDDMGDCTTTCSPVYCDGTIKRTVSYDEVKSELSANEGSKLLIYDGPAAKPQFGSLDYDFGLSWMETTGSSDTCS